MYKEINVKLSIIFISIFIFSIPIIAFLIGPVINNDDGIDDILYLHDGYGSIKIDENLQSLVDLTTDGGTITFWYKLDCDTMDNLEFEISRNGSSFDDPAGWTHIGGQTDWKQATIRLIPGTFNLEWAYDKDDAISHYSDTVWIDDIIVVANQ